MFVFTSLISCRLLVIVVSFVFCTIVRMVGWYLETKSPRAWYSAVALPNLQWVSIPIGVDLLLIGGIGVIKIKVMGMMQKRCPIPSKEFTNPIAFHEQGVIGGWSIIILGCCFGVELVKLECVSNHSHHLVCCPFGGKVQIFPFWWLFDHLDHEFCILPKAIVVEIMEYFVIQWLFSYHLSVLPFFWEGHAWPLDHPMGAIH